MLAALDVGNTQTHLGVFEGRELLHEWRSATEAHRTADELALLFDQFLALQNLAFFNDVTGVAISSVVPRLTKELRDMTHRYFGWSAIVVEPGVKTGIAVLTDHPREVGADRIANAVAAHELYPGEPVIVVDFGTALTVDAISAQGEYLGGAIAPGIETAAAGLFSATAQLPRVELVAPSHAIGKSTVTSVQSGIMFGTAALVDGLVDRTTSEMSGAPRVIATGGLASTVVPHCARVERVEPLLTLLGLRSIYHRNAEEMAE